ncbi:MAG: hypothetical protein QX198_13330 [Methylococcaceae bacterium]
MSLKKRGLGRGLEALLADESAREEQPQTTHSVDYPPAKEMAQDKLQLIEQTEDRSATVLALFKNIQRENRILLEEAESLRQLIAEFESIVRAGQS